MVSAPGDLYNRNFGGKLKLKGLSKSKGLRPKRPAGDPSTDPPKASTDAGSKQLSGTGRIVSSGTTVQGFETTFVQEVAVGDSIIVKHPVSKVNEERVVSSILSNRTLCVDEAFSNDLITTSVFLIKKPAPKGESAADGDAASDAREKGSTITVREKVGMWSYKTTTKVSKSKLSAEDRLNERVKHTRDKYCW